jgi:hypothetical protein
MFAAMMVYSGMFFVLTLLVVCTGMTDIVALHLPRSKRPPCNRTVTFRNYVGSITYHLVRQLKHATETIETASKQLLVSTPAHRKTCRHGRLALSYRCLDTWLLDMRYKQFRLMQMHDPDDAT